jgi:uncharacterized membrane protein
VDSGSQYNLTYDGPMSLGKGYSLQVKQIDNVDKKVWLELDRNGQYVDDAIISTDSGDHTWNSTRTILGVPNVPVLKVHVNRINEYDISTSVIIDGNWLIDYANAKTLKVGDSFGISFRGLIIKGGTITKIINGIDASFLGELILKKIPNIY